jgi:hypothetical protein
MQLENTEIAQDANIPGIGGKVIAIDAKNNRNWVLEIGWFSRREAGRAIILSHQIDDLIRAIQMAETRLVEIRDSFLISDYQEKLPTRLWSARCYFKIKNNKAFLEVVLSTSITGHRGQCHHFELTRSIPSDSFSEAIVSLKNAKLVGDELLEKIAKLRPQQPSEACFVATVCLNDVNHPYCDDLRGFRDKVLIKTKGGRWMVEKYYSGLGSRMAGFVDRFWALKPFIFALVIYPLVKIAKACAQGNRRNREFRIWRKGVAPIFRRKVKLCSCDPSETWPGVLYPTMATDPSFQGVTPDPAAVLAIALSLREACLRAASADSQLDLGESYAGMDQFMRELMRIAECFESWACAHVAFDEITEIWPYLLEEHFGNACLDLRRPDELEMFDHTDCLRLALQLGLPVYGGGQYPVPLVVHARHPVAESNFKEFRIQTMRNGFGSSDVSPLTVEDNPFDTNFDSPFYALYGVDPEGLLEHIADRSSYGEIRKLAQNLAPGVAIPVRPISAFR